MVPQSPVVPVSTGDFGMSARHPSCERIAHAASDPQAREGVAAIPYTDIRTPTDPASSITTTHSRAGGHGGPPLLGNNRLHRVQIYQISRPTRIVHRNQTSLITRKQHPHIWTTNITVHCTRHKAQPSPRKENRKTRSIPCSKLIRFL